MPAKPKVMLLEWELLEIANAVQGAAVLVELLSCQQFADEHQEGSSTKLGIALEGG